MQANTHGETAAGETYCGVGALRLLGRLTSQDPSQETSLIIQRGFTESVTRWLVQRQTTFLREDEDDSDIEETTAERPEEVTVALSAGFQVRRAYLPDPEELHERDTVEPNANDLLHAGFNGRCNKVADTCYSWWVGGTLSVRASFSSFPRLPLT